MAATIWTTLAEPKMPALGMFPRAIEGLVHAYLRPPPYISGSHMYAAPPENWNGTYLNVGNTLYRSSSSEALSRDIVQAWSLNAGETEDCYYNHIPTTTADIALRDRGYFKLLERRTGATRAEYALPRRVKHLHALIGSVGLSSTATERKPCRITAFDFDRGKAVTFATAAGVSDWIDIAHGHPQIDILAPAIGPRILVRHGANQIFELIGDRVCCYDLPLPAAVGRVYPLCDGQILLENYLTHSGGHEVWLWDPRSGVQHRCPYKRILGILSDGDVLVALKPTRESETFIARIAIAHGFPGYNPHRVPLMSNARGFNAAETPLGEVVITVSGRHGGTWLWSPNAGPRLELRPGFDVVVCGDHLLAWAHGTKTICKLS